MSILIIDSGWNSWLAEHLGRLGEEAVYWSPWERPFPQIADAAIGAGFKNVTRALELFEGPIPELVLSLDLSTACLARGVAAWYEVPLWGTTPEACEYETDRSRYGRDGLQIIGIDALADELDERKEAWVKLSGGWRGVVETAHVTNDDEKAALIHRLRTAAGPLADSMEFVVESPILNAAEAGLDLIYCAGQILEPFAWGYEVKDKCYVGRVADGSSSINPHIARPAVPENYSGFCSTESRVNDKVNILMDVAMRVPAPPGISMVNNLNNFVDVIRGDDALIWKASYFAELVLKCQWPGGSAPNPWMPIRLKESEFSDSRRGVAIRGAVKIGDTYWVVPGENAMYIGSAWGLGETPDGAIKAALKAAEDVQTFEVAYEEQALPMLEKKIADGYYTAGLEFEP